MKKLLTMQEAREALNVSRTTMLKYIEKGMPAIKMGRDWRFDMDDVLEWLKSGGANDGK